MIPAGVPQVAVDCHRCLLARTRQHIVWGEGPDQCDILFLGEAPGAVEDRMARPMVGPAGKVLDEVLEKAGMPRRTVYIANCVKCRPPENKMAQAPGALAACRQWLLQEVSRVKPKVVVLLGATAAMDFFPGMKVREFTGKTTVRRTPWGLVVLVGCYHPSALARDRNNTMLRETIVGALRRARHELALSLL